MKKINVLHIGTSGGKGGIESFILNVCSNLDEEKFHFNVIADCEKAAIEDDFKKIGEIIYIPSAKQNKIGYIKALWKIVDNNFFDVVHIHKNSLSNPTAIYICKLKGINKIILHSHNTKPADSSAKIRIHEFFKKRVSHFKLNRLACSKKAADWMFVQNNDYFLLKNGIETEHYAFNKEVRKKVRSLLKLSTEQIAICNVGRLCDQKNTLFIIEIMYELIHKRSDAKLFLIGTGELEQAAKEKVRTLHMENNVIFLGRRTDVNEILQGMDLFLMPSLHEGLPIAAIEAQASSLPLLISDTVDPNVKILDSTEFESLEASAKTWAEHCLRLIETTQRRDVQAEIKQAGYDIRESIAKLKELYNS